MNFSFHLIFSIFLFPSCSFSFSNARHTYSRSFFVLCNLVKVKEQQILYLKFSFLIKIYYTLSVRIIHECNKSNQRTRQNVKKKKTINKYEIDHFACVYPKLQYQIIVLFCNFFFVYLSFYVKQVKPRDTKQKGN